jgi:integrase/recombinase XerD
MARHKAKKLPYVLAREDAEAIKAMPNTRCATGLRNRAMLEVMHGCGLRVSEVCALRRADIRWAAKMIEVRGGKGGKDRPVPYDAAVGAWLEAWDAQRPRGRTFFTTVKAPAGGPVSPRYVQQLVRRLAMRVEIAQGRRGELREVTPHTFRHAYATELLEDGFNIREVQDLLGHADVHTTEIYTHVRPEGLAEKIRSRRRTRP